MKLNWTELFRDAADPAGAGGAPADDVKNDTDGAKPEASADAPVDAKAAPNELENTDKKANGADPDKSSSLYDDLGEDEPGKEGSKSWPEDWRVQMAGGDEKAAKALARYSSPDAVGKALIAAKSRLRSGEYKRDLPEDATPEQISEWRKERGIPDDAKDYELPILLDGNYDELDDFGKESVDTFRGAFHELNLPPESASKIMTVANEVAMKQMERQAEQDAQRQEETEDALRTDWGADYRKNIQLNAKFMEDKFGDNWQSMITARTPEGLRLADDPKFNKFINDMARAEGGTILESGEVVAGQNAQARIDEIRKIMQSDYPKYKRDGLDKEYSKLLEGQNR